MILIYNNFIGLARKQKQRILKHKDPLDRDTIATDRIFAPLKNEGWPIMCGFSNTRAGSMSDWQREETREMSEQRGN